jgi:hypothetical protein
MCRHLPTRVILTWCVIAAALNAQGREPKWATLKALKSVSVLVEDVNSDADKSIGLRREDLQVAVELQLRKAGINVDSEAQPYLYVNTTTMCDESGICATFFNVELKRIVFIDMGGSNRLFEIAPVWYRRSMGMVGKRKAAASIRDTVARLADEFANDFLAANPPPAR